MLQESIVCIGAEAGCIGNVQEIAPVSDATCNRIFLMSQHAGIHVIEDDIVMGQRKVGEGRECYAAFQHSAHHTRDTILFTYFIDTGSFEDTAGFGELNIDIIASVGGNEAAGVVVIKYRFVR